MIKHRVAPLIFHLTNTDWLPVPSGESLLLSKSPLCNLMDFTESAGDWSLAYQMPFCSQNDYKLLPESQQQIKPWQPNWPRQG